MTADQAEDVLSDFRRKNAVSEVRGHKGAQDRMSVLNRNINAKGVTDQRRQNLKRSSLGMTNREESALWNERRKADAMRSKANQVTQAATSNLPATTPSLNPKFKLQRHHQ